MLVNVMIQVALLRECLLAVRAHVCPFARMDQHMLLQVFLHHTTDLALAFGYPRFATAFRIPWEGIEVCLLRFRRFIHIQRFIHSIPIRKLLFCCIIQRQLVRLSQQPALGYPATLYEPFTASKLRHAGSAEY